MRVLAILGWLLWTLRAIAALLIAADRPSDVIIALLVPTALLAGALALSILVDRVRAVRRSDARHIGSVIDTAPRERVLAYPRLGTTWELARILATVVLALFGALLGYALLRLVMSMVASTFG